MSNNALTDSGRLPNDPARTGFAVTPSDTVNIPEGTRGLYVGASGDVAVILLDDTTSVVFTGLAAGIIHPIAAKRVLSTGTTATGIVGVR